MRSRIFLYIILIMSSLVSSANTTLNQLIDSALVKNGIVSAARVAVEKSRILEGTAFDPDMTSITLKQTTMDAGNPDNGIAFGQDFDFPTVYVARHKVLKAETEVKRAQLNQLEAEIRRDVTSAYFQTIYASYVVNLRKSTLSHFSKFSDVCQTRFENGEISKLQYLSAKNICGSNEREYEAALNDYQSARAALETLTGCRNHIQVDSLYCLSQPVDLPESVSLTYQPEIRAIERQLNLDNNNYALARQAFLPGITVGATAQCYISGFNPYNVVREKFEKGNFMSFEVGVTVPLFFTGKRAALRAAKRDRLITRLEIDQKINELRNNLAVSYAALENYSRQVNYYRETGVPDAEEMQRLAQVEYENGEITYHEFMEYMAAAVDVKLKYAEIVNAYNQEYIKYKYLTNQ